MAKGFKDNKGKFHPTERSSGLESFQIKKIGENLGELDLELRDVRSLLSEKLRRGDKAVGELKSQQRTVGQSRGSIVDLVRTLPKDDQIAIFKVFDDYKKEFTE